MKKVVVTVESTSDLSDELKSRYGILAVPLYISMDDGEYLDGVSITSADMFEKVSASGKLPKTAAAAVADFSAAWKPYLDEGCEIVHVTISSELSACYQNACLCAGECEGVYVVDSRSLSTGIGQLAIEAAIMAENGCRAADIAAALEEKRERLNVSFVLDTMDYLAKGGRCSSVTAFAAGLLKLRLCIEVENGKMDVAKKYRGKMSQVLCEYARERLLSCSDVELDRIFITDSGVDDETRRAVRDAILEVKPFSEILFTRAGTTISSHCGPKCLGILFFTK